MAAAEFDLLDSNGYALPKSGWSVFFVDSEETAPPFGAAVNAIDDDMSTMWRTSRLGPDHPHEIQIFLGSVEEISALYYVPRQDGSLAGTVTDYSIFASQDCASWEQVADGTWAGDNGRKIVRLQAQP